MVHSAELTEPKGKVPYINTDFVIVEGEHKNQHVFDNISLSEKEGAKRRLNGFLFACGVNRGDGDYDTDELVGKLLVVKCGVEEYQGVERARPSSFRMHPSMKGVQQAASAAAPAAPAPAPHPAVASVARRPV
jgi:hypothetical protein